MAQIVPVQEGWGTILGGGLGKGIASTLEGVIHDKARRIAEKQEYERNLQVAKGLGLKNADQISHASPDQFLQLIKQGKAAGSNGVVDNSEEFQQALEALGGGHQAEKQFFDNPEVQKNIQEALNDPQVQQQFGPDFKDKATQFMAKYQQTPTQQLGFQGPVGAQGQPSGMPQQAPQSMYQGQGSVQALLGGKPMQGPTQDSQRGEFEKLMLKHSGNKTAQKLIESRFNSLPKSAADAAEDRSPAQQARIETHNATFLKPMTEYIDNAKERGALAQEALDLVQKGEVTGGPMGLLPEALLTSTNKSNADFVKIVTALANRKALEFRGPVGKAKLESAAREKASLSDPKESQEKVLMREIQYAKKAELLEQAYDAVMEEHGYVQPQDIESKIRRKAKELAQYDPLEKETEKEDKRFFDDLPPAGKYTGKRLKASDGSIMVSNGKEWVRE